MAPDITSPANERIKWLVRLRERRHRDAEGVFVVEGPRLYHRALDAGLTPAFTFVTETWDGAEGEVITVASDVLDRASYRQTSEGVIAVFPQFATGLSLLAVSATPLVLVAEDIEKPGNLGAMMRTASAAGADAVVVVGGTVDPFNPNAVRASTGALFSVPLAVTSWDELGPWLSERGIVVLALDPKATTTIWDTDLSGPVAVVIGAEATGLSERATDLAQRRLSIPQADDGVDSLNASVAAAVVMFEAVRQRSA
jgi:TrmH family RNA methyltransferase